MLQLLLPCILLENVISLTCPYTTDDEIYILSASGIKEGIEKWECYAPLMVLLTTFLGKLSTC
jgi:hypothetical protein